MQRMIDLDGFVVTCQSWSFPTGTAQLTVGEKLSFISVCTLCNGHGPRTVTHSVVTPYQGYCLPSASLTAGVSPLLSSWISQLDWPAGYELWNVVRVTAWTHPIVNTSPSFNGPTSTSASARKCRSDVV